MKLTGYLALLSIVLPAVLAGQETGYVTVSDGARLFYRTSGHAGPGVDTIIAVHGGPGLDLGTIYNDMAVMFGDRHVVIYYDQRGGGRSALPADTTQLFAPRQIQDLDDLRKHFKLERITLVAHSYGPLLAGSYAIAHPANVKKMIFFGPVPPRRGEFQRRYGQNFAARLDSVQRRQMNAANRLQLDSTVSDSAARAGCREYWRIGMRPRLAEPDRTWPLMKADFCETDLKGIRYGARYGTRVITSSFGDWDLRPALASLRVPLLVVHGEQETIPMDLIEEWVTSMPSGMATLLKVPRAAHFPYLERPEIVWPAVERFLNPDREALLLDPSSPEWTKAAPPVSYLKFETTKGAFVLELVRAWGPIGADRLYNLARLGYYDDARFHRVNKEYIAQFGLNGNPAVNAAWKDRYIADDPPRADNKRGTFAFSMKGPTQPGTRSVQIYINLKDNTKNNVEPFTILGTVVEGMSVVDSLYSGYGENSGAGVRQGRQGPLAEGGNAFIDKEYPLLDHIIRVSVSTQRPRAEP
jgi:proline-specific peptidase